MGTRRRLSPTAANGGPGGVSSRPGGPVQSILLLFLVILGLPVHPVLVLASSWDEVLERYHACRQRQTEVAADLDALPAELKKLDVLAQNGDREEQEELAAFVRSLRVRYREARDGFERLPGLLREIEAQIEEYRGSGTCPECIESSTLLLCSVVDDLAVDVEGCLSAARECGLHLRNGQAVAQVLGNCRKRLAEVRRAFEAAGALPEVEQDLRDVESTLDEAADALGAGRRSRALVRVLDARLALARLAVYLDAPP